MMTQEEQMLRNELVRLDRVIGEKERELATLLATLPKPYSPLTERPRRYSIEFEFEPVISSVDSPVDIPEQTRTFLVDGGKPFRIDAIDTSLRVIGQAVVRTSAGALAVGQNCSITIPFGRCVGTGTGRAYRNEYFDFFWSLRNNTNDRQYQNVRQPSVFLLSGSLAPQVLPIRDTLPGGTEIALTIEPILSFGSANPDTGFGKFAQIRKYVLQVSFAGVEVLS